MFIKPQLLKHGIIIMKGTKNGVKWPKLCIFVCLELHVDNFGHLTSAETIR
jgi:hypothetical protein